MSVQTPRGSVENLSGIARLARSAALRSVWYFPMIRKIFLVITLTTNDFVESSKLRRRKMLN